MHVFNPFAVAVVASVVAAASVVCNAQAAFAEDIDDGYVPIPNVPAEAGDTDLMTGYSLLDAAKTDNAVCLDGSPGMYYHRPGTGTGANKWYIHQEGGGWCSSVGACQGRSLTNLGSSKNYTATIAETSGYFSLDAAINPLMYNWNMVYFKYCDGGSFSGSNASSTPSGVENTVLHWRGKHVLNGGITDMLQKRGLAQAAEVVVSGCSAGGLAAFLHCDHFANRIHAEGSAAAKVVCTVRIFDRYLRSRMPSSFTPLHRLFKALPMAFPLGCSHRLPVAHCKLRPNTEGMPDSGLFRDYQGCTVAGICTPPGYHDRLTWVFNFMNASSGVNDACVTHETPLSNCMFAEHTMKYLITPTFPLQGEYDAWQIEADLGIHNADRSMPVFPNQTMLINEYGANFTAIVHANLLSRNPKHSIFLDSCFHHCGGWGSYHAGPTNATQPFAMKEWYDTMDGSDPSTTSRPNEQKTWIQGKQYPCLDCCH
jgi:hypothetical protein